MPHAFPNPFSFPLPISLAIINQMNTHTRMFFPTFILEYVSHDVGYYFSFINFITWIFDQGCYKLTPLGEHHPQCSMTPITNMTAENKTYYPWSFITHLIAVFTMKNLLKIKTSWHDDNIPHNGAL